MKRTLLTIVLALMAAGLWARPVDPATARSVARQFWRTVPGSEKLEGDLTLKACGLEHVYLFVHSSGTGFVAMSGDDCAEAVLGYSVESPSGGELNPEVRWWLEHLDRQIGGAVREARPANEEYYEAGWERPVEPLTDGAPAAVAPMIATLWDQGEYYNDSCPVWYGERCLVGCVATAMGQLMKYWNHPYRGSGSYNGIDFGNTRYGWDRMPMELTAGSSTAEVEAVSQLLYHAGKAVNMTYRSTASSAYTVTGNSTSICAEMALQQYFGYSRRIISLSRGRYTTAEWLQIVKGEVAAGRPVLYAGDGFTGGHAFLCDGYDAQSRLHFNWGWSGAYNGYFASDALRPGSGGLGSNQDNNYTMNQEILVNVFPEWTVGLPFNEDFSDTRRYWSGSLAAGDTLQGPVVALPQAEATLTWQATGGGSYAILLDGAPVYSGSDATGSVSLQAYASSNRSLAISVANGSVAMTSLAITDGSSAASYTVALQSADNTMGRTSSTSVSGAAGEIRTVRARPSSGYHFTHWSDGSPWNPRPMALSGDETLTAHFEPNNVGDTLRKDNGAYVGYQNTSSSSMRLYGMPYPANAQLTAVEYYPMDSGLYRISFCRYVGGVGNDTIWRKVQEPAYPGMWNTVYLNLEVHLDNSADYTVYLEAVNRSGSPRRAEHALVAGDYGGSSLPGIRCVLNGLFNPRQLTVIGGSGSGIFLRDTTVLIYADQGGGNRFLAWNDGNTDNPRSVRVVSDTSFTAVYSVPSRVYVRFESSDTTLGRVNAIDGWRDYEESPLVNNVEAVAVLPRARFLGWSSTAPDTSEIWATNDQDYTHPYIYLDSAYVWNHDTLTFTANFSPVEHGDTLIYDDGGYDMGGLIAPFSATCAIGTMHKVWGVKYDPALLARRDQLTAVQLFTTRNYQYDTVRVYSGGANAPQTLLREQVFGRSPMVYQFGWQTYTFSSPVAIDPSQPVWVTISAKDEIMTTAYERNNVVYEGFYTGNPDGSWVYEPGTGWRPFTVVFEYGVNGNCHRRLSTASDAAPYFRGTWPLRAIMPEVLPYYTLTVTPANAAHGTVGGGGRYRQGTAATLTATPAAGYRFLQWQDGDRQNPRTVVVVQDTQFVATFEALPIYTITVASNNPAMGTVSGGGSYYEGATATLTATPTAGHRFVQWHDGVATATRTVTVTANATYTATFETIPTYTITVVANDPAMGTVSGGGSYYMGDSIVINATPNAGHRFVQWNDGNRQTPRIVAVTANATYTATFEAIPQYTLTVVANDIAMGTVSGGGSYPEGATATLTATPNEGHRFVQWHDGNRETSRLVTVTADATYTATFEAIPRYTITVLSNDTAMGTVSGGGSFEEGSTATLTATPKEDHHFVQWHDGNTQASRTVAVTGNATYTATFEADPHEGILGVEADVVAIYPNPATDKVTLVLPWPGTATEVRVLTVDGRERARMTATGDRCTIDVSGYPVGTYVVRVSADGRRAVGKIEVR